MIQSPLGSIMRHRALLVAAFMRQHEDEIEIPKDIQSMIFKYFPRYEYMNFVVYNS